MFVVSCNGNKYEEVKTIEKKYLLNDKGEEIMERINHLKGIKYTVCQGELFFGNPYTIEEIENLEKDCIEKYATWMYLYINGKFVEGYTKDIGEKIFSEIIFNIQKNKPILDLRDYEKGKETD